MKTRHTPLLVGLLIAYTALICDQTHAKLTPAKVTKQQWYKAQSTNFTVISDIDKDNAIELIQKLEKFRAAFQLFTNSKISTHLRPLKVYATNRDETYSFLTGSKINLWTTTHYFNTRKGNYAVVKYSEVDKSFGLSFLLHHYTHRLTATLVSTDSLMWYTEGLAQYMSQIDFGDDNSIIYNKPINRHLAEIHSVTWMPLKKLFSKHTPGSNSRQRQKHRRVSTQGWLLVHYLNSSPELSNKKQGFLTLLSKGVEPNEAAKQALGQNLKELTKNLKKHARKGQYQYSIIKLKNALKVDDIEVHELKASETLNEIGELALHAKRDIPKARRFYEKSLEIDTNNSKALAALATTYIQTDQEKAAELLKNAKKIAPQSPVVATVSGQYNSHMFSKESDKNIKNKYWNRAVRDFNIAINSGDKNVEALTSAATLYEQKNKFDKSLLFFEHAYAHAPSNYSVHIGLVKQYLMNDEPLKSKAVVSMIKRSHHSSKTSLNRFDKWHLEQLALANKKGEKKPEQ